MNEKANKIKSVIKANRHGRHQWCVRFVDHVLGELTGKCAALVCRKTLHLCLGPKTRQASETGEGISILREDHGRKMKEIVIYPEVGFRRKLDLLAVSRSWEGTYAEQ